MSHDGLTAAYRNLTDSNIDLKIVSPAGKLHQLPLPPLEFTEPHRLPPLEIGPENSINYPPRIHGTSSTTPPRNRAGKLHVPVLTDFASQNLTSMQKVSNGSMKFQKEMKEVSGGRINVWISMPNYMYNSTVTALSLLQGHFISSYVLSSQDFSDSQPSFLTLQSHISKHSGHKLYKSLPRYDTMHKELSW